MTTPKRGGVVIREGRADLRFLPASVVVRIEPFSTVSRVPGAPKPLLGLAHLSGEVVPVVLLGEHANTPFVVCRYLGETVAIAGCEIVGCGTYEPDPQAEGVMVGPSHARTLDLGATFASLQGARWALRFGG